MVACQLCSTVVCVAAEGGSFLESTSLIKDADVYLEVRFFFLRLICLRIVNRRKFLIQPAHGVNSSSSCRITPCRADVATILGFAGGIMNCQGKKVFLGSPSEGELKRGDLIGKIRDFDATKLSHKQASDLITKAGNVMKLVIVRIPGHVPVSPPISPIPMLTSPGTPVTLYHLTSSSTTSSGSPVPMYASPPGSEHLFQPLPATQFQQTQSATRSTAGMPYQQGNEALREKVAITNQPYRSVPLILPGVKTTKDTPTGSYLRFSTDVSGRSQHTPSSTSHRLSDAYMLSKVQEAVNEAAQQSPRASVSSGRTPTPDSSYGMPNGPQVYLRQYNSPINMYSNQAIMETIASQTAAATKEHDEAGRTISPKPPSDISKSPTYQLIHEEEWRNLDKKGLKEQPPVQERVHNVIPRSDDAFGEQLKIHQSGSFRTLMTSMQGLTEF